MKPVYDQCGDFRLVKTGCGIYLHLSDINTMVEELQELLEQASSTTIDSFVKNRINNFMEGTLDQFKTINKLKDEVGDSLSCNKNHKKVYFEYGPCPVCNIIDENKELRDMYMQEYSKNERWGKNE